jgi:hypothetical protein
VKKYAIDMTLPKGKLPGFYAQIVKALAGKVLLFDRDKELLIVNFDSEREMLKGILDKYQIGHESLELVLLPDNTERTALFGDYGFTARSGYSYLYAHLVAIFHFKDDGTNPSAEKQQAILQYEEHLIARFIENNITYYAIPEQLEELVHGIAKAYACEVHIIPG